MARPKTPDSREDADDDMGTRKELTDIPGLNIEKVIAGTCGSLADVETDLPRFFCNCSQP